MPIEDSSMIPSEQERLKLASTLFAESTVYAVILHTFWISFYYIQLILNTKRTTYRSFTNLPTLYHNDDSASPFLSFFFFSFKLQKQCSARYVSLKLFKAVLPWNQVTQCFSKTSPPSSYPIRITQWQSATKVLCNFEGNLFSAIFTGETTSVTSSMLSCTPCSL